VTSGTDAIQVITATLTSGIGTLSGTVAETASEGVANFTTNGMNIDLVGAAPLDKVLTYTGNSYKVASNAMSITPSVSPGAGYKLTNVTALNSLKLVAETSTRLTVSPKNEDGDETLDMPGMVWTWRAGTCGTLSNNTGRSVTFTAVSTSCNDPITVHATQGGNLQIPSTSLPILVNVSITVAPAPEVAAVDPAVVIVATPAGLDAADVSTITPVSGGTFSVPQESGVTTEPITLVVPSGALDSGTVASVTVTVVESENLQAPPPAATEGAGSGTFTFGSTAIDVQWYDETGTAFETYRIDKPAEICLPYTASDLNGAALGPDGLNLWRFNGTEWVKLNSSVNTSNGTVCANTSNFSVFAIGLDVAAPVVGDASAVGLPATGGYSPNQLTMMLTMLAGLGLAVIGVGTIRRTRKASSVR
ncbi:MAG: hypothetical protein ACKVK0_19740, partial [Pirellulales bacterium]